MPSTALKSLFGGKTKVLRERALAGNVGGQKREQTVLTPEWFLNALKHPPVEMYMTQTPRPVPGQIEHYTLVLDPCTTPENPTGAIIKCTATEKVGDRPSPFDNGLLIDWQDTVRHAHAMNPMATMNPFVWVNPPFAELDVWLRKIHYEALRDVPIHALIPFRPHRVWFGNLLQSSQARMKSLAPFPFVGSKSSFPAPLLLCSWNIESPRWIGMPMAKGKTKNIILKEWRL